ncbi:MAG: hypothetical protein WCG85_06090 [Polyangia bacterium]
MRRAQHIAFFLAVLACALALYWQRSHPRPKASKNAGDTSVQVVQSVPPPRLALAKPKQDAEMADTGRPVLDESSLMQQIRAHVKDDPSLAEALAREARQRFADSSDSDERDALLVDALINQQRIGAARSETYYYFDHHPGGRFGEHLFVMTGVHPRPAGPGR